MKNIGRFLKAAERAFCNDVIKYHHLLCYCAHNLTMVIVVGQCLCLEALHQHHLQRRLAFKHGLKWKKTRKYRILIGRYRRNKYVRNENQTDY